MPLAFLRTPSTDSVASICCYCGTGCGVRVQVRDARVIAVEGDVDHPSSRGALCSKGTALADTVRDDDTRVLHALSRVSRDALRQPVALEAALDQVAQRLAEIVQKHGPDSVAFYVSGQLLTEDYVMFNKLARGLIGTNNIDTNSRLCMSSAVAGYKQTLGADAPPACYDDIDLADTVMVAGSNMAYAHPVLFRRLLAARAKRPDMKLIVVDPRQTDTTLAADLHLKITPGTDVALFHAMLHVMIRDSLLDQGYIDAHTTGFATLQARVQAFSPAVVQTICGVPALHIEQAAHWFAQAGSALSLYTMGLNQSSSGTAKNATLIHLHLATGHIGRPGCGPFSLTGQPNAMGGREAGGMATLLPGHRDPADALHRQEVADLWGVDALPDTPGAPAIALFERLERGAIKAVWIVATNPAQSMPDQAQVRRALTAAEFVVVQDAFAATETLAYADVVLPAATWPEKEGTVTNSERRISRVRAAIVPPGDAQADWRLAAAVGQRLARHLAPHKAHLFDA
ncbi:MAG: nitrate reductase, partial [Comamonadaceae bacterium]